MVEGWDVRHAKLDPEGPDRRGHLGFGPEPHPDQAAVRLVHDLRVRRIQATGYPSDTRARSLRLPLRRDRSGSTDRSRSYVVIIAATLPDSPSQPGAPTRRPGPVPYPTSRRPMPARAERVPPEERRATRCTSHLAPALESGLRVQNGHPRLGYRLGCHRAVGDQQGRVWPGHWTAAGKVNRDFAGKAGADEHDHRASTSVEVTSALTAAANSPSDTPACGSTGLLTPRSRSRSH